jgi:hypothetical protein
VNEVRTDDFVFIPSILNGLRISEGRVLVTCCRAAKIPIEQGWWFMRNGECER